MAKRHGEDDAAQDDITTDAASQDEATDQSGAEEAEAPAYGRRTMVKAAGTAVAAGTLSGLFGNATAAEASSYLSESGDVTIPAGKYSWDGSGLNVSAGDSLVGEGNNGDVVLNLESGTMDGNVAGHFGNVIVRGANNEAKAGINLQPGATVDGFVWPEGGQQDEDRAFYTPNGGDDRLTVRNSAWGQMVNNGAYIDKPPVTMENCAAVNNNIANIRVGHRDGTSTRKTTYIRNSIIAVTEDIQHDVTNVPNSRGIRLRHPANLVIENCWFIYLDVNGTADLIELHDGAAGSTVTIRDCAFYNDSGGDLVRDKSNGEMDVTIENCTFSGSGSQAVEPSYSGSGITVDDSVDFPLPSAVTGYAAADEISGVGDGIGPWGGSTSTQEDTYNHTLVLHAAEGNSGTIEATFTVDGPVDYAAEAESDTDRIVDNGDGTYTVTSVLAPDELDSFRYDASVVDYSVPDGETVDVSLDGSATTWAELIGQESVVEVIARQSGELNYEFTVDGSAELHETSSQVTAGHGDEITQNDDGTVTVSGFTGNAGYGDAYLVQGSILSFSASPEDYDFDVLVDGETVDPSSFGSDSSGGGSTDGSTDTTTDSTTDSTTDTTTDSTTDSTTDTTTDSTTDSGSEATDSSTDYPHLVTVTGDDTDATTYTFTVSGSVVRDAEASEVTSDGTSWDEMEDIARDGKVIGLVGSGVDAYRFDGRVESITVDGEADLVIRRNA